MIGNRLTELIERATGEIIVSIGEGKFKDVVAWAMMEAFRLGHENAEIEFKRAKVDPKKRNKFIKSIVGKGKRK